MKVYINILDIILFMYLYLYSNTLFTEYSDIYIYLKYFFKISIHLSVYSNNIKKYVLQVCTLVPTHLYIYMYIIYYTRK